MKIYLSLVIALSSLGLYGQEESFESGSSWEEVVNSGKGKLIIYWHPNNNFDANKKTVMDGVEDAMFRSFIDYTEQKNGVRIELNWKKSSSFNDVLYYVSNSKEGVFGSSSISITPPRKEILNFTPPHFPDIAVLISNGQFPLAKTHQDFKEMFQGAVMISIPNTTLENKLLELSTDLNLNSTFVFVNTGGDVIGKIESIPNSLGYLDLANFMTAIKGNSKITRQYFYPVKLDGLAFAYPLNSDWGVPIDDYYSSSQFLIDKERVINEFLGEDVNELITRISKSAEIGPYEEIILLTEEKEFQAKELLASALREQQRQRMVNWLFAGVFMVIIIALFFYIRYQIKVKANEVLMSNQQLTEKHNKQLLTLNQEKNDLIRVLAHDLRNPINQLLGFSELLLNNSENFKGDQVAMLGFMKQSSEKLRDMINKILDVDAIEAGDRNVVLEKLVAEEIVVDVFNDFSRSAKSKGIELKSHIESNVFVLADKVYLTQILENLVSNALKFSAAKTVVLLSMFSTETEVVFVVKDEGPGFSKKDQEKIFKKYQQLSAKSTAGEPSTGLGLSIVKMFVEMMGGTVTYESEEGVGTTFNVRLPRAK